MIFSLIFIFKNFFLTKKKKKKKEFIYKDNLVSLILWTLNSLVKNFTKIFKPFVVRIEPL